MVTVGVTCGGNPPDVLLAAGARRVYRDAEHLLTRLDEVLSVASPTVAHLTRSTLEYLMGEALAAARDGLADGGLPVGAVLAGTDGDVVARGFDPAHRTGDRTRHAEMVVLAEAAGRPAPLLLATTLEPCVMCVGATMQLAVDAVVFGPRDPANGGVDRVVPVTGPSAHTPRFVGDVRTAECLGLFRQWLAAHGQADPVRAAWVGQLLSGY